MPSGFGEVTRWPPRTLCERLEDGLLAGAVALEQGLGLAADLGDAEEQVLGRDVLVAEATGLVLGALDDAAWRAGRGAASRPRSGRAGRGRRELAAERGQVDAEPAERLGGDAVVGFDERVEDVLGVEDGAVSRAAVAWAATMASWAFWVKRSSCMSVSRSGCQRGSGLVDELEGGLRRPRRLVGQVGRAGRPWPWRSRSPWPVALKRGMPWPVEPERPAGLRAGGDRQQDAALERPDRDLAAEQRLAEGQRQLALEVGAAARERRVAARA